MHEFFMWICRFWPNLPKFLLKESKNDETPKIYSHKYFEPAKMNSNFKFAKNYSAYYWPRFQKKWFQKYKKYGYIWYMSFSSRKTIYHTIILYFFCCNGHIFYLLIRKKEKKKLNWPSAKLNSGKFFEIMLSAKINSCEIS